MPKRLAKHHLEHTARRRRKSVLIGDPTQLSTNLDDQDEHLNNACCLKPIKHMQYIKFNQNDEVERLLLHNSKLLLYNVDHSDFPAFNVGMWPQETSDMLSNYPLSAFSIPRPIFVADNQYEKIDVCYERPMNRCLFKNRLRFTRTTYQTALQSNKNIRSSIKGEIYHNSVFDVAERVYMQPHTFFQSSYDYYFTGGNLCVLPYQGNIIHTGGEELQEMLVSEFPTVKEYSHTDYLQKVASLKMRDGSEIFEIHPLITARNNNQHNFFISRQQNIVALSHLKDNNQIKTVTQFRSKSTPFISFAQSNYDINNFIITTMKQHIRLYDLSSSVPKLVTLFEMSLKHPNISWNSVKPWRENTFLYANEKQFFMIDIRTSPEQWLKEASISNDSFICDHISAILPSEFNNLFYVATNHKLQCMDIRHIKKFSLVGSGGGVCRWSHQLRFAPLMIDTFRLRESEYVALSSPKAGDLHICQLSRQRNEDNICLESTLRMHKHIYSSRCLPYQPPTLLEAYENARLSGKCLRPKASMDTRLKCCTTGMKFINSAMKYLNCTIGLLLISNSNGDVFAHTIIKREDKHNEARCNGESDKLMTEFERKICEQVKLPLKCTEVKKKTDLRQVFLCKPLSSIKQFRFAAMDNEYNEVDSAEANNATNPQSQKHPKRLHLGRWQKPLSTLHSYKDAMVSDLLSIWDMDIEEETHIRVGNLRHTPKTDSAVKVENWLKQNVNSNTPPTLLSIPFAEISSYCRNDSSNIFDSTLNTSQTQNTIDFENAAHSTQILNNNVNSSKNSYASGGVIHISNGATTSVLENLQRKKKNKNFVKGF